ncbi:hypothetical protein [Pedobacter ureilyticus]|uniref:Uncharacterized protein n=1 Tax=Pedobacter ureilyticus TaxID=1393051 RepID=A0ABW9J293_9SPHI|nr:hypothetical protein [Pedobacter helvus]
MKLKFIFLFVYLLSASAICQAQSQQVGDLMKSDFEKFYALLKQKEFDKAVNYVSEDYLKAGLFSKEQMKNLLKSNFDNWETLPDLKVTFKDVNVLPPKKLIQNGDKTFGVLEAVMHIEMTITGNYDQEEIETTLSVIEAIGKGRHKVGNVVKKDGSTTLALTDKRLVAGIYNPTSKNVRFAIAEIGLSYTFQKFLPKEIVAEMKTQL